MTTYRVETLLSCDAEGTDQSKTWGLAQRRGPKMDNGPALGLEFGEAQKLVATHAAEGAESRIVAEEE